jgi:hypothetical protein
MAKQVSIKQVSIYVSPYLYKVLRRDYGYQDRLSLPKRYHIYMHRDTVHPARHLVPDSEKKEILIEGPDFNYRKAYAIIRNIEAQFREKMNVFVKAKTEAGVPSRAALREFIELYDILEEELKLDSCYKDWSRYKAKDNKRSLIPLWI